GSRVGAVLAEFHHLGAMDDAQECFGAIGLDARRPHEIRAAPHGGHRRVEHGLKGMAETHRPVAHAEFDEFVAVDVPDATALASFDKPRSQYRILIVALRVGMAATWNQPVRPFPKALGPDELRN